MVQGFYLHSFFVQDACIAYRGWYPICTTHDAYQGLGCLLSLAGDASVALDDAISLEDIRCARTER